MARGVGIGAGSEPIGEDIFSWENREAAVTNEAADEQDDDDDEDVEPVDVFELRIGESFGSSCQQLRSSRLMPALTAAAVAATTAFALH